MYFELLILLAIMGFFTACFRHNHQQSSHDDLLRNRGKAQPDVEARELKIENRHNFEECQKLREEFQKARIESESLERLLEERNSELESSRKEIETLKVESVNLEKRIDEMQVDRRCKDAELDEFVSKRDNTILNLEKLLSEKQDATSLLESDLARIGTELSDRESRITEILKNESSLKSEHDKEKEELVKEVQALSKQLEEAKQTKPSMEQALKENESRMQILREDLKRERENRCKDKEIFLKIRNTIMDAHEIVNQRLAKLTDELSKHSQSLRTLQDEVDKMKNSGDDQSQSIFNTILEDFASAYFHSLPIEPEKQPDRSSTPVKTCEELVSEEFPIPCKLTDDMQTPGTVFPAYSNNENDEEALISVSDTSVSDNPNGISVSDNQNDEEALISGEKVRFGRTPGDRQIFGTVASHWNNMDSSHISYGIPNSTSKYKEDQKVRWHATPFEVRLEKALSEETFVSQRGQRLSTITRKDLIC